MYKGKLLTGAVLSVFMAGAYGNACAADGTSDAVYSLNPVVVTATRYEKSDAEIPAATQTFTEEQIEQTGADNLQVALQYLDGVIDAGMGPNGTSVSSMTTKNVIRGVSNGTVVMINGTPINWRTNYNLENIPTSAVERVEVVRGGGAVLYGSQATGGVINIITKKTLPNEVKVGLGNKGRQEYAVAANAGDLSIAYTYNKWGKLGYVSSSDSSIKQDKTRVPVEMKQRFFGSEKNDFLATYKLNDHADFLYNHNESASRWAYTYTGITDPDYEDMNDHPRYIRRYENDKDFLQFNFHGLDGISGHVFYNYNTLKTHGTDYYSSTGKKYAAPKAVRGQEKNKTYGYDVQKVWDGNPDQTFLIGTSLVRETFENETSDTGRNIISAFGSWERNLTAKDVLTLSGRGTWTTGGIQNFHNFSGQAQYLHKLDNTQSLYASVGQSFVLPTFSQMYSREQAGGISNIIGNPDLKPQKGLHYEAGWKKEEINGIEFELNYIIVEKWKGKAYRLVIQRQKRTDNGLDLWEGEYTYRCILTNDYESSERDIVEFYNLRGGKERVFDDMNNGFGWRRLPKSFMAQNTVFLLMTALVRNFYKAIMQRLDIKKFGLRTSSRIKTFVFKFISVPAKWIKTSRQHVLNIYTENYAYAYLFQTDFG